MDTIKISIIVPVFNVQKHIEKTINSILDSNIDSYECILIDENSSDNSYNICQQYQQKHKQFKCIKLNTNDFNTSRNTGLSISAGKYLYFINGGDILHNNFLNDAINFLENNKDINVFIRNYETLEENGKTEKMSNYFAVNGLGPLISMCVFRKSAINVKFQDYICSDIIFAGKVAKVKNKFSFDYSNFNSFIQTNVYNNENDIDYLTEFNIDWYRYVEEEIKSYTSKKFNISYHVMDRCNKNCIACGHFSPLADQNEKGVTIEQFEKDVQLSSFLNPNVNAFILTGGEPTLHENLLELIKIATKYFDSVHLCSNGLNRKFFIENADFLNKNNIRVYITRYNLDTFDDILKVINHLYFYDIPALQDESGKRILFNDKHLSSTKVNTDRKFYCERGNCSQLREGKLYLCQYSSNFHLFKNYFKDVKLPFDERGTYIDLTYEKDVNKIIKFLYYQYPTMCEYCKQPLYDRNINTSTVELTRSKNEITEWYE